MKRFTLRVRVGSSFQDLQFIAESLFFATQQAESQYGPASVMGFISEDYI